MANNTAFVASLGDFSKIEGADRIISAKVIVNGIPITQVVVGVDTVEGAKVVYFDSNLCIKPEVIEAIDKLSPSFGKEGFVSTGNYLGKNGRVRSISLKKTPSDGLVIPVEKFYQWEKPEFFKEGVGFTSLGTVEICHKYVLPVRASNNTPKSPKEKKETTILPHMFPEHIDTLQLKREVTKLNPDDVISISTKIHGTSLRVGRVLTYRNLSLVEKVAKWLGANIQDTDYKYAYGSRTVTKEITGVNTGKEHSHFYEGGDLWTHAGKKFFEGKLHEGENIYCEIFGYTLSGSPIQKIGKFVYNYGCAPGSYDVIVYRISRTSPEGIVTELSVPAMKERCKELGVKMFEELYYGKASDLFKDIPVDPDWHVNFLSAMEKKYLEKEETNCLVKGTPSEGVCLRVENGGIFVMKLKSLKFLQGESASYDKGETQDTEEVS